MRMRGLSSIFPVPDIKRTAEYYVGNLGFSAVEYLNSQEPHICLYLDKIEIILLQANTDKIQPNRELYGYGYDAYLYTDNQEALEKEFVSRGIKIVRPLNITDYQNKEFVIEDIDGRWLAFGLKQYTTIHPNDEFFKLEIFIPETHFADLRKALQSVDAGHIGKYDCCMSYSRVIGTWRPLPGTDPFIGEEGMISEEEELKVEVTVKGDRLDETIEAIKAVHPYEEPVINVIELLRTGI